MKALEPGARALDHLLVSLQTRSEGGDHHFGVERVDAEAWADALARARAAGLVEGEPPRLTPDGDVLARDLLRRYRLAERLLSDLLGVEEAAVEEAACGLEHVISEGVTDALCTLLGHPPVCPHGRPIPPGRCCREAWRRAPPVILPLSDLPPGARGRIAFVGGRDAAGIDRLAEMGLLPGVDVRLVRRLPVPTVEVGETRIALETSLAAEIFVRPAGAGTREAPPAA